MHFLHSNFLPILRTALLLCLPGSALPGAPDPCIVASSPLSTCPKPGPAGAFKFAVLGDSWASGVAYNAATEYDKGKCRRNIESHGVQMKNDLSWAGPNIYFDFPARSGSKMEDIVGTKGPTGICQICQLKDSKLFIITIGGNDASVFAVVDSCLYHSNGKIDYGLPYDKDPDRKGRCATFIDSAKAYIENTLRDDLQVMYTALLKSEEAKSNPDLRIYQTGYAHFFNVDEGNTWCDKWGFWIARPRVTLGLRTEMNDLIERGNRVTQDFISSLNKKKVGYISITEVFDGHRFCEPRHNIFNQFSSNDVWLWNLSPSADELAQIVKDHLNPSAEDGVVPWKGPPLWEDGSTTRPFQPKVFGYKAIKDAIIKKLRDDKVPGIVS